MSSLYYVTSAQTPNSPTFNIYIQKSTDSGVTYSTVYNGPLNNQNFDVLDINGVLHIFGDWVDDPNFQPHLWVFRFDTSTDSMLDAGTDLGVRYEITRGIKAAQFVNGKVHLALNTSGSTKTYLYDPVLNTLSSGVTIDQSGQHPLFAAVVDPATDTAFAFFGGNIGGGPGAEIDCVAVSNTNVQQSSVIAFTLSTGAGTFAATNVGKAVMSGGKICIAYSPSLSNSVPTVGTLRVARATPANAPVFATELVYTDVQPPYLWTSTNANWFIPSLVDVSGTLYAIFQTNLNQNDDNTSQASLQYATSTVPGTWSAASVAFAGPAQSDNLSAYPVALSGGVGIVACYMNPTNSFPGSGSVLVKSITLPGPIVNTIAAGQTWNSSQISNSGNGPTNLLFEIGSSSLTLACPVTNTGVVGQPYTGMLIASGGTPPYTYAIIS